MEYKKNKVMAYKQNNNPFKKIDTSAGAAKDYVDFNKTGKASTPYSTVDGDLMSGTGAGLGQFGKEDAKIGGINRRTGEQEVGPAFTEGGNKTAIELDEALSSKLKRQESPEASIPAVDVTAEGPEKAIPSSINRGDARRQRRADAQARRQERRASRQKARQDRREARRSARDQRRQQRQATRARR